MRSCAQLQMSLTYRPSLVIADSFSAASASAAPGQGVSAPRLKPGLRFPAPQLPLGCRACIPGTAHSSPRPPRTCEAALLLQDGLQAGMHVLGHGRSVAAHVHVSALAARHG